MTPKEKAMELVNEKFYQPITIHLNINNNSEQIWGWAKICAGITVREILSASTIKMSEHDNTKFTYIDKYWNEVHEEINKL